MKLEIGMYVRTHFGIRKIKNIKKDNGYGKPRVKVIELDRILDTIFKFDYEFYTDEKVIKECKASHNIIDLIEVGDVITFKEDKDVYRVLQIPSKEWEFEDFYLVKNYDGETEDIFVRYKYMKEYIKSIVTKEQFESMQYKVGE